MAELWGARGDLHRTIGRRSPNDDVAADIVAETYLVVWRRLQDVPRDLSSARAWLFAAARKIQANARRRLASHGRLIEVLGNQSARQAATDAVGDRLGALEAFRSLSEDDQDLLRLVATERPTLAALAQRLGCSEPAAASRLWRARTRLSTALGVDADGST